MVYRRQTTDVSFGRKLDGGANWFYFDKSTPNAGNNTPGYETEKRTNPPKFSLVNGFYRGSQSLKFSAPAATIIRYTTDGSIPTNTSAAYSYEFAVKRRVLLNDVPPCFSAIFAYSLDSS